MHSFACWLRLTKVPYTRIDFISEIRFCPIYRSCAPAERMCDPQKSKSTAGPDLAGKSRNHMTATFRPLLRIALLVAFSISSWSANFSFFTTMRAGLIGPFTYEMAAGSTSATTQSQSDFFWDPSQILSSWRPGDLPQSFRIGYRQATNTGFVNVRDMNGTDTEVSFSNPGTRLNASAVWTLPVANFFASATSFGGASSVNVENLSFSSGVQVLSGALPTRIGANYSGTGPDVTNSLAAPIVFTPASAGGDWTISGTIRFNGLFPTSGTALGGQLQFLLGALGTDTPEASTALLIGAGLLLLGVLPRRKLFAINE